MGLYAHARINREATLLISQHPFGVTSLKQAPPDKGAQDAPAQGGLCSSHHNLVDSTGRMEDYAWRGGFSIGVSVARHFLKHPINYAHMEMHMFVQTYTDSGWFAECGVFRSEMTAPEEI